MFIIDQDTYPRLWLKDIAYTFNRIFRIVKSRSTNFVDVIMPGFHHHGDPPPVLTLTDHNLRYMSLTLAGKLSIVTLYGVCYVTRRSLRYAGFVRLGG